MDSETQASDESRSGKPGRKWQLAVSSENSAVLDEIDMLVQMVGLDEIAPRRHSALFALTMFGEYKAGGLHPFQLKQEIMALETGASTGLRGASQFRHQPLKGLWHKHYMQGGIKSLARNVKRGLDEYGSPLIERMIREAAEAGETRYFTPEHIPAIARDLVEGNWKRLQEANDLTGEWIIFAKHNGENYYLALATHEKATHNNLRQNIDAICGREFPFLNDLLGNGQQPSDQDDIPVNQ